MLPNNNYYYFFEYISSNKLYDLYDELINYHPNTIKKIHSHTEDSNGNTIFEIEYKKSSKLYYHKYNDIYKLKNNNEIIKNYIENLDNPAKRRKYNKSEKVKVKRTNISDKIKLDKVLEQQGKCNFCGYPIPKDFNVDHIIPLEYKGLDEPINLHILCIPCHKFKTYNIDKNLPSFIEKKGIIKNKEQRDIYINICREFFHKRFNHNIIDPNIDNMMIQSTLIKQYANDLIYSKNKSIMYNENPSRQKIILMIINHIYDCFFNKIEIYTLELKKTLSADNADA